MPDAEVWTGYDGHLEVGSVGSLEDGTKKPKRPKPIDKIGGIGFQVREES